MLKNILTKFNSNKVIKAGFWYTAGNFFLKGISFLTLPIFTRLLSTADYGLVNTYMAYEGIVSIIIGLGLAGTVKSAKYEFKEDFEDYLSSTVALSFTVFLFVLFIGNIFFETIQRYFEFSQFIYNILILNSYASFLILFVSQRYIIEFQYKKFLLISFINTIFSVVLSLTAIVVLQSDKYMGRIIGQAVPMIIIGMCIFYRLRVKKSIDKRHIKFGLIMGVPLIAHYLSQSILSQFDRIMIQKYISSSEAGIYSFVYNVGLILNVILISLQNVWTPWVYSKIDNKEYADVYNKSKYFIVLFSILTIGLITISPEIIMIMSPKQYWSGINMVLPIVLSVYCNFIYILPADVEYFFKKTHYIGLGTIMAALLNIILNIYFIPRYGSIAAAYTTLISYIGLFVFHWIISRKIFNVKLYSLGFIIMSAFIVGTISSLMILLKDLLIIRYGIISLLFMVMVLNYKNIKKNLFRIFW